MFEARTLPAPPGHGRMVSGLGVASLVLGLVGLVVALMPCVGMVGLSLSILALILGLVGLLVALADRRSGLGFPIAGMTVSVVACVVPFVWVYVLVSALETAARKARDSAETIQA